MHTYYGDSKVYSGAQPAFLNRGLEIQQILAQHNQTQILISMGKCLK